MKRFYLFALAIVLSHAFLYSQSSQWQVLNTSNSGLPHNTVNHIIQDNEGNYWIATLGGLAKYDGSNWTIYNTSNSNLEDDRIHTLFFDGDILWIGYSFDGLAKFDGTTFTNYDLDDIFVSYYQGLNQIKGIDMDKNHNLWIATSHGLLKYDGNSFFRYHNGNGLIGGSTNRVWSVKCDTVNDIVWAGTFHAGLLKFDGTSFTQYYLFDPSTPYWGDWQQVNSIAIEDDGDIWISGSAAIIEFDKTTMVQKHVYTTVDEELDPLTWGMAFDHTNKLWVGSDCLYGVFCLNNGNWTTYNETNSGFPQGTCYSINTIHVDQNNTKWMAHNSKGIVIHNEAGVGINEQNIPGTQLNLFPNPSSSTVTFDVNYSDVNSMEVFDYTGKLVEVKSYSGNENNLELEINSLSSGIYGYRLQTNNSNYIGKFIKE